MFHLKLCFGLLLLYTINGSKLQYNDLKDYFKQRRQLIKKTESDSIGAKLNLTSEEEIVNNLLMLWKNQAFEEGMRQPEKFLAGRHFFDVKAEIEKTQIFKFIQKLPKGASLHSHDTALVCSEYIFENITFRDNLYAKNGSEIALQFSKTPPDSSWKPISWFRQNDNSFDQRLKQQITLFRTDPEVFYIQTNIWSVFESLFTTLTPLLTFEPVFRDYYYQALKELYEDNIKYLELRGILPTLYDLEGRTYGYEYLIKIYYETTQQFIKDYPDFWGVKFIFAPHRVTNNTEIEDHMNFIVAMNRKYPNFIAGFDLVGQEDTGTPLKSYIPALLEMKRATNLFFHAGETLWNGARIDENLIDAVLLNTSRIGHGYAVLKHPEVMKIVKERGIALEICPISNQVLGLVRDLRNHPANYLIAHNYPVVIAPDDPSFWGAKALSYDWYMAFMGMSSKHSDLRLLKQLAINSIVYSSMEEDLKNESLKKWTQDWEQFIKNVIFN
ncbi:unnamed protein product [Ceutorhynchus assimilis]|uniref:Adenosine deaminase n=1 Tax=Ceutorhynchus assimilis TaxID=467358 RepID=A0A9N9MZX0_9CUCU|nr:unnamed protein product [Ceutorhynchus assimilis]